MPPQRAIEMEELSQYFKMPEKAVAKHLGICLTSLKKICRQNGIHRWPYRKIKSLDKKLRKLENAMVSAKDDPSMVHAVSGYSVQSDCSEFVDAASSGASSPTPSASEASVATTPRQVEWSSGASSPQPEGEVASAQPSREASVAAEQSASNDMRSVPVTFSKPVSGQPIKVELSLSADMLKQMADGTQNFTFMISSGANGETQLSLNGGANPMPDEGAMESSLEESFNREHLMHSDEEPKGAVSVKEEQDIAQAEMSDEDIIAMLADCASAPVAVKAESFAQVIADNASATDNASMAAKMSCLEPSDAELMAALAGCCGGSSPFEQDFEGEGHAGAAEDSRGFAGFYHDDDVMGCFSHGQVSGMEDFLGMHA
mmetsp:Transcript_53097/g.108243  ORF Transcript_53097/g.108243 Transcript_53097/m.108243 type:complete len:373 (-) Transcript_53097:898-2016(-)|eukprot:CAMPEP_0181295078 /NCGR_PEP_ID=MMETSP1101-20121128/3946_1 /TAXON_ID=46948 /ORGANISM="Rhodomonas abbreviata, Strain Caron Lab Isolate" /LENGTH=372 /DNA_ID=CAMNT_0023399787 /DNA_START=239 /DNA_END=1357 /DNA_ORIENTATION=-